jgi:hypothetical protein
MYAAFAEKHGAPQAAEFILMLVANLGDEDRLAAANIILATSDVVGTMRFPDLPRCVHRSATLTAEASCDRAMRF